MKKTIFFLSILSLLLTACQPDVESCFTVTVSELTATFSSACSIEAVTYNWEFGDSGTSTAANPSHTYALSGTYTVTLWVEDNQGNSSSYSAHVTVVGCSAYCENGQCVNNACVCDPGYEGVDCSTAINAKFEGNYSGTQTCTVSGAAGPYAVDVSPKSGTVAEATFVGLWEVPVAVVTAVVGNSGADFTIARQPIGPNFDIESTIGTISANGSTINIDYKIYQTGGTSILDHCTVTLTK